MHPVLQILSRTSLRPEHSPEAAAVLHWHRLAAEFDVPASSALSRFRSLDRVVLVLIDGAGLGAADLAPLLNADTDHVRTAHAGARRRAGLPAVGFERCDGWTRARAEGAGGDPHAVIRLVEHVPGCQDCRPATIAADADVAVMAATIAVPALPPSGVRAIRATIPSMVAALGIAALLIAGLALPDHANAAPAAGRTVDAPDLSDAHDVGAPVRALGARLR